MLEYGFNELDNDFVTLWSKKIVSGEDSLIFTDLTKLAELGQINAIQSWYLLARDGDSNAVIDNFVSNLGNGGANELLAIAHKHFFKNDIWRQMCEWDEMASWGYFNRTERQEKEFDNLKYEIQSSTYGDYYSTSIEMYYNNYKNTHNQLMLERFYEMMAGRTGLHKKLFVIEARTSSIEFRKLRKTLLEMYEQDKNNVAVAFALGKNLTLFKSNASLKALGSQILTDLSKRELSKTLENYEIKGTKRLIKQQIDENSQSEAKIENMSAEDRYIRKVFENARKTGIKFLGDHGVGALSTEEIGIDKKSQIESNSDSISKSVIEEIFEQSAENKH